MAAETFSFRFKDLDLDGALISWNDVINVRLARHSYLKRDGAEQEPMGAEPGRFTVRLALMGPSWSANYRALVASIRQDPRGLLVHPLLGNLRVACTGISDASAEPGRATRLLEVTLGFEEDALDATVAAETFTAPATATARVSTATTRFQTAAAPFTSAAVPTSKLAVAASAFSAAAQAVTTGAAAASLSDALTGCGLATDAAVAAILADPRSIRAVAQSAVSRAVELYAACVQLEAAVSATRPPIIDYTVSGAVNLFVLAARLYPGQDARKRAQDILALNRIPNPLAIAVGTVLRLARPTVS